MLLEIKLRNVKLPKDGLYFLEVEHCLPAVKFEPVKDDNTDASENKSSKDKNESSDSSGPIVVRTKEVSTENKRISRFNTLNIDLLSIFQEIKVDSESSSSLSEAREDVDYYDLVRRIRKSRKKATFDTNTKKILRFTVYSKNVNKTKSAKKMIGRCLLKLSKFAKRLLDGKRLGFKNMKLRDKANKKIIGTLDCILHICDIDDTKQSDQLDTSDSFPSSLSHRFFPFGKNKALSSSPKASGKTLKKSKKNEYGDGLPSLGLIFLETLLDQTCSSILSNIVPHIIEDNGDNDNENEEDEGYVEEKDSGSKRNGTNSTSAIKIELITTATIATSTKTIKLWQSLDDVFLQNLHQMNQTLRSIRPLGFFTHQISCDNASYRIYQKFQIWLFSIVVCEFKHGCSKSKITRESLELSKKIRNACLSTFEVLILANGSLSTLLVFLLLYHKLMSMEMESKASNEQNRNDTHSQEQNQRQNEIPSSLYIHETQFLGKLTGAVRSEDHISGAAVAAIQRRTSTTQHNRHERIETTKMVIPFQGGRGKEVLRRFDWTCKICEFINTNKDQECLMCGNAIPSKFTSNEYGNNRANGSNVKSSQQQQQFGRIETKEEIPGNSSNEVCRLTLEESLYDISDPPPAPRPLLMRELSVEEDGLPRRNPTCETYCDLADAVLGIVTVSAQDKLNIFGSASVKEPFCIEATRSTFILLYQLLESYLSQASQFIDIPTDGRCVNCVPDFVIKRDNTKLGGVHDSHLQLEAIATSICNLLVIGNLNTRRLINAIHTLESVVGKGSSSTTPTIGTNNSTSIDLDGVPLKDLLSAQNAIYFTVNRLNCIKDCQFVQLYEKLGVHIKAFILEIRKADNTHGILRFLKSNSQDPDALIGGFKALVEFVEIYHGEDNNNVDVAAGDSESSTSSIGILRPYRNQSNAALRSEGLKVILSTILQFMPEAPVVQVILNSFLRLHHYVIPPSQKTNYDMEEFGITILKVLVRYKEISSIALLCTQIICATLRLQGEEKKSNEKNQKPKKKDVLLGSSYHDFISAVMENNGMLVFLSCMELHKSNYNFTMAMIEVLLHVARSSKHLAKVVAVEMTSFIRSTIPISHDLSENVSSEAISANASSDCDSSPNNRVLSRQNIYRIQTALLRLLMTIVDYAPEYHQYVPCDFILLSYRHTIEKIKSHQENGSGFDLNTLGSHVVDSLTIQLELLARKIPRTSERLLIHKDVKILTLINYFVAPSKYNNFSETMKTDRAQNLLAAIFLFIHVDLTCLTTQEIRDAIPTAQLKTVYDFLLDYYNLHRKKGSSLRKAFGDKSNFMRPSRVADVSGESNVPTSSAKKRREKYHPGVPIFRHIISIFNICIEALDPVRMQTVTVSSICFMETCNVNCMNFLRIALSCSNDPVISEQLAITFYLLLDGSHSVLLVNEEKQIRKNKERVRKEARKDLKLGGFFRWLHAVMSNFQPKQLLEQNGLSTNSNSPLPKPKGSSSNPIAHHISEVDAYYTLQAMCCRTAWLLCGRPTTDPKEDDLARHARLNGINDDIKKAKAAFAELSSLVNPGSPIHQTLVKYSHYARGALARINGKQRRCSLS
eukprot:g3093.t1